MPTVDDYGYDFPPDPGEDAFSRTAKAWRRRLREQARENAELRRQLRAYEEAAQRPPETPGSAGSGDQAPPDRAAMTAELAEHRRALAEVEAQSAALAAEPVGVSPEDRRAAELIQAATDGAMPQVDGLEGMLARLRDRAVPYEQLQREMRAFGFRDPPADG